MDFRVRPERIAGVLLEVDPDMVALQEVLESQAEYLARKTGLQVCFGAARQLNGCPYGNAVLSRSPAVSSATFDISVSGREPRSCMQVTLQHEYSTAIHLFAVHLGTSLFERRKQAVKLISPEILGRPFPSGVRIVAGDFNEWTKGLTTAMLSQHLQSADVKLHLGRSRTYPGVTPFMHLDHIYYDREIRLSRLRLHNTNAALFASDHLPLVADFQV